MNDTDNSPFIHTANGENFQSLVLGNLDLLAEIIATDPRFKDSYARNSMQKVFAMIGVNHVLAKKYRDTLSRTAH